MASISAMTYQFDKDFLQGRGYELIISIEKYFKDKELSFVCIKSHCTTLKRTAFANKKKLPELCSLCVSEIGVLEKFEDYKTRIFKRTGHNLLSIGRDRNFIYQCGTCGRQQTSHLSNMLGPKKNPTKFCSACLNANTTKRSVTDIREQLNEIGMFNYKLIEYRGNKEILMICPLGHEFTGVMYDFKRDRRCPKCGPNRRVETNIKKYGTGNVLASYYGKNKIIETENKRYGGHHMKLPEIQKKRDDTVMNNLGVQFAFHTEEAIEKNRAVCMELYGAEYAMHNPVEFKRRMIMIHKDIKEFVFPSGRSEKVLGYEHLCLNTLLESYPENDIITDPSQFPQIKYQKCNNGVIKNCIYYPDIMVGDKLIEVKCEYTYKKEKELNKF